MKYLLDTNICIRYMNGRSPVVRAKIRSIPAQDIIVCSIVRAELAYGAGKSQTPEATEAKHVRFLRPYASLSFDDVASQYYGKLRALLDKQGTPIGSNDALIAAIGLAHNLILVTHNIREFSRIDGLIIEDWEG